MRPSDCPGAFAALCRTFPVPPSWGDRCHDANSAESCVFLAIYHDLPDPTTLTEEATNAS